MFLNQKRRYITSYEDQWIEDHFINKGTYPIDGTIEEKDAFAMSVIQKNEDYKEEHPDYKKEIRKACIAETKKHYEKYLAEQKRLLLKIEESKKSNSTYTQKKEHRSVLGKSSRTELMQAPLPLKTSKVFFR